jgi:rhodanese-related sulfurtransferase
VEQWTNIEPEIFLKQIKAGELTKTQIIDVREQEEWDYYHLEHSTLIPLQTIPNRLEEFQSNGLPIYIICAHGVRSVAACRYLNERGYSNLTNVAGGMAAVASLEGFEYD